MNVFVCTRATQGGRANDFCWGTDGELVRLGLDCDGEKVDGRCGCRRSMTGMVSQKATTTVEVMASPLTRAAFHDAYTASMTEAGWGGLDTADWAEDLLRCAAAFPVRSIVERRGEVFQVRQPRRTE